MGDEGDSSEEEGERSTSRPRTDSSCRCDAGGGPVGLSGLDARLGRSSIGPWGDTEREALRELREDGNSSARGEGGRGTVAAATKLLLRSDGAFGGVTVPFDVGVERPFGVGVSCDLGVVSCEKSVGGAEWECCF